MKKTNKLYLEQFLERIERLEIIVLKINEASFLNEPINQDAVIRNLEVLGEISKRFSKAYKNDVPEIPWMKIQGMRNKLIHEYEGINLETVWLAAVEFVPLLKPIIINQLNIIDSTKH